MALPNILARAAALGIEPPIFSESERPSLWEWWQARVLMAEIWAKHDVDPTPIVREAAIFGGHLVEPSTEGARGPLLDLELFRQLRGCVLAADEARRHP